MPVIGAEMQSVVSITSPKVTQHRDLLVTVASVFERVLFGLFTCWHWRMGWPRTRDQKTFRTCVKCGMCRQFDPQTWKSLGPFYWDDGDRKSGVG